MKSNTCRSEFDTWDPVKTIDLYIVHTCIHTCTCTCSEVAVDNVHVHNMQMLYSKLFCYRPIMVSLE